MKYKRLLAIAAAILLLLLYVCSLVFALMDSPLAQSLLMASVFCTFTIPGALYAYTVLLRYLKNRR